MRKLMVALGALLVVGCADEPVEPTDGLDAELGAILAFDAAGFSEAGRHMVGIHRLPRELRLSAEQESKLKTLLAEFEQSTRPIRDALAALHRQAEEARRAGKSRAEVTAILAQGAILRSQLAEAEEALAAAILAVLTPEQRAWLAAHQPRLCNRNTAPPLTEEQRTEIAALIAEYQEAHQPNLAALKVALEKYRAAVRNGASRSELRSILQEVREISLRLREAAQKLRAAIDAVLTDEQRASGCYRGWSLGSGVRR